MEGELEKIAADPFSCGASLLNEGLGQEFFFIWLGNGNVGR